MKKLTISALIAFSVLFQSATVVYADSSLDKKYKEAYDATMQVVKTAEQEKVKPFWKLGSSDYSNVVCGVMFGMQKQIITARAKINELPSSTQIMKNTLSSILDDYQHPIYEKTIEGLWKLDEYKSKFNNFTGEENGNNLYLEFQEAQNLARSEKRLIKDMPSEFKSSYSSAIDERQQYILNASVKLVDLTKKTKDGAFKMNTYLILNHIRNSVSMTADPSDRDDTILDFANCYILENDKTVPKKAISNDDLINLAITNGFKDITDSAKPFVNKDIDKVFENADGSLLSIYNDNGYFNLVCPSSKVDNFNEFFNALMPMHVKTILSKAKQGKTSYMLGSNSLNLTIKTYLENDLTLFSFGKFYDK